MAKLVLTNSTVSLNGQDISSSVAAITISTSAAEVPTTNFGSGGAVTRVSGLIDNSVTLSMHNDYNAIDGLIFPLIGSTAVTMIVKPAGTAAASAPAAPARERSARQRHPSPPAGKSRWRRPRRPSQRSRSERSYDVRPHSGHHQPDRAHRLLKQVRTIHIQTGLCQAYR